MSSNDLFKSPSDINLSNYGLYLNSLNIKVDNMSTDVTMEFSVPNTGLEGSDTQAQLEKFFTDLKVINSVRNNPIPAVRDQWEALLILLALAKSETETKKDK